MLSDQDILCFSSIDWDFIWQGHQEIMSTLAAHGNRVLFVENTGVRTPALRDLGRVLHRIRSWWRGTKGFREVRENLVVYSPVILPFPYSRVARAVNRRLLARSLRRWMSASDFHRPIFWTFLPTPLALDLIRELDPKLTVYYCVDDLASSSRQARRIAPSEIELCRRADLIFATSDPLRARAAVYGRHVHSFPFGVSFAKFADARRDSVEVPADLRVIPRPVVGYMGGLHQWVDQELLATLAERMPDVHFALVGPAQADLSRLEGLENVHLLGARPHNEVPRYIKGFDVGIVPYRLSDYTAHVYPSKLNEYLAMGIPVVATDLQEVRRYNAELGGVVTIATDAASFESAIRHALEQRSRVDIDRRIAAAARNSWEARIAEMERLIVGRLAERPSAGTGWESALRRLYHSARRRLSTGLFAAAMIYLLLFQSPFLWYLAAPLEVVGSPRPADAIVVFAGGVGESGKPGGGYQERTKTAVDLYRAGMAPRIVISSGYTFVFDEARVMKDLAVSLGVPDEAVLLEVTAKNTHENVRLVATILAPRGAKSLLLVSSPFHMRRALMTWHKVAPAIKVIPSPVPNSQFYAHDRGANFEQIRGILEEYAAIAYYWWRGWATLG